MCFCFSETNIDTAHNVFFDCGMLCTTLCDKQNLFSPFSLKSKLVTNTLSLICQLNVNKETVTKVLAELHSETNINMGNGVITGSIAKLQVSKLELLETKLKTEFDIENLKEFLKGVSVVGRSYISYLIFGSGIFIPDYINAYFEELKLTLKAEHFIIEGIPQYPSKHE